MSEILRPDYGIVWAAEGEKVAPLEAKFLTGWAQEMMPFQWENFLQNRQDVAITYLLQKGIPEWSNTQEYIALKSVVMHNGVVYSALTTHIGSEPAQGNTRWKRVSTLSDNNGVVQLAGGGTGATTATQARLNLGLGTAATLNADNIVQKDSSGNFTANIITASLNGNASTASKLLTARNITIGGISKAFDGSANIAFSLSELQPYLAIQTTPAGATRIASGTTAQRPVGADLREGDIRFNEDEKGWEGYKEGQWAEIGGGGGATGGKDGAVQDEVFFINSQQVTIDYTIPTGKNAMSAGPVVVQPGITVTVPDGSSWSIV